MATFNFHHSFGNHARQLNEYVLSKYIINISFQVKGHKVLHNYSGSQKQDFEA